MKNKVCNPLTIQQKEQAKAHELKVAKQMSDTTTHFWTESISLVKIHKWHFTFRHGILEGEHKPH